MNEPGMIYDTKNLKDDGVSTKLKRGYTHKVLLIDTVEEKMNYTKAHGVDSLNAFGWCKFDDVAELFGKDKALQLINFCEKKVRKMATDRGVSLVQSQSGSEK